MSQPPQPPAQEPPPAAAASPASPGGSAPLPPGGGGGPYGWAPHGTPPHGAPPHGAPLPPAWAQPWAAPVLEPRSSAKAPLVLAVVALGALLVGGVAGFLIATVAFLTGAGGMVPDMGVGMAEESLGPVEQFPAVAPGELGPDPVLDEYADACFAGDHQACDDLLYESPPLSEYEEYGSTCGGRVKPFEVASCTELE